MYSKPVPRKYIFQMGPSNALADYTHHCMLHRSLLSVRKENWVLSLNSSNHYCRYFSKVTCFPVSHAYRTSRSLSAVWKYVCVWYVPLLLCENTYITCSHRNSSIAKPTTKWFPNNETVTRGIHFLYILICKYFKSKNKLFNSISEEP